MSKGKNRMRLKSEDGKHIVYVWDVKIAFSELREAWEFIDFINHISLRAGW